jgi:tetratricopeptide (TPR) repeat protein
MFIRADMVSGHIRELRQRNPGFRTVIEALGTDTDLGIQDFFRSIRLHLLSLFYVELIEALVKQNIVDMGRASLRVGWIYRDLAERPDQASAVQPLLKNLAHTIHPHWPTAPFDEPSALRQASSRYMQSIEKSRLITDASDRVQLLQIVGRIHLRIKEYEKAAENLRAALASAREARSRLDQELKAKDSDDTADQRAQKVSEVRRLTTLIDEADRLVELAQEERLKNDTVKAKALLAQVRSRSPEQQRAFLRENGITPRVISALLPEEKRGMFG